jgi:hypothetical protein
MGKYKPLIPKLTATRQRLIVGQTPEHTKLFTKLRIYSRMPFSVRHHYKTHTQQQNKNKQTTFHRTSLMRNIRQCTKGSGMLAPPLSPRPTYSWHTN